MNDERLIKKYTNRRLYDAKLSRHVTLADIRAFIVAGQRVRVVEDKTNQDVTRAILLQALAEQEQFGRPILSVGLLEALIRFYGSDLQDMTATFLETSLRALAPARGAATGSFESLFPAATLGPFGELARRNYAALKELQAGLLRGYPGPSEATPAEAESGSDLAD